LLSESLPEGADWIRVDGYRALAIKTGGKVQLRSRNDNDFTGRYTVEGAALQRWIEQRRQEWKGPKGLLFSRRPTLR
jgi:ATP-dependent DNA ligase